MREIRGAFCRAWTTSPQTVCRFGWASHCPPRGPVTRPARPRLARPVQAPATPFPPTCHRTPPRPRRVPHHHEPCLPPGVESLRKPRLHAALASLDPVDVDILGQPCPFFFPSHVFSAQRASPFANPKPTAAQLSSQVGAQGQPTGSRRRGQCQHVRQGQPPCRPEQGGRERSLHSAAQEPPPASAPSCCG